MISRWKHSIAIILLVIFVFTTCLSGLVLNVQLLSHRAAMKDPSAHGENIVIVISETEIASGKSSFHWISDREFSYNNKMYDAIELTKVHDKWIIVCGNDAFEESLLDLMRGHSENTDQRDALLKKSLKFCDELITYPLSLENTLSVSNDPMGLESRLFPPPYTPISEPPPWLA